MLSNFEPIKGIKFLILMALGSVLSLSVFALKDGMKETRAASPRKPIVFYKPVISFTLLAVSKEIRKRIFFVKSSKDEDSGRSNLEDNKCRELFVIGTFNLNDLIRSESSALSEILSLICFKTEAKLVL